MFKHRVVVHYMLPYLVIPLHKDVPVDVILNHFLGRMVVHIVILLCVLVGEVLGIRAQLQKMKMKIMNQLKVLVLMVVVYTMPQKQSVKNIIVMAIFKNNYLKLIVRLLDLHGTLKMDGVQKLIVRVVLVQHQNLVTVRVVLV